MPIQTTSHRNINQVVVSDEDLQKIDNSLAEKYGEHYTNLKDFPHVKTLVRFFGNVHYCSGTGNGNGAKINSSYQIFLDNARVILYRCPQNASSKLFCQHFSQELQDYAVQDNRDLQDILKHVDTKMRKEGVIVQPSNISSSTTLENIHQNITQHYENTNTNFTTQKTQKINNLADFLHKVINSNQKAGDGTEIKNTYNALMQHFPQIVDCWHDQDDHFLAKLENRLLIKQVDENNVVSMLTSIGAELHCYDMKDLVTPSMNKLLWRKFGDNWVMAIHHTRDVFDF